MKTTAIYVTANNCRRKSHDGVRMHVGVPAKSVLSRAHVCSPTLQLSQFASAAPMATLALYSHANLLSNALRHMPNACSADIGHW